MMRILKTVGLVGLVLVVAACARTVSQPQPQPGMLGMPQPMETTLVQPQLEPQPQLLQARLNPGNYTFVDGAALPSLNPTARSAATDAQFYALQYGRPGAPRSWNAGGASGQVSVGPYVRVNNLDCREFSHRVTVGGTTTTRSGTACREVDGAWNVVDA